jgi:hypothetical protein
LPDAADDRGRSGKIGRGERIRTSGLYVPNVALYQAKLHPEDKGALEGAPEESVERKRGSLELSLD